MSSNSDEKLMKQFATGDADAFSVVYRRHKDPLYAFLLRQVSVQLADELFQEIWTSVIEHAEGFRQQASFRTWLFSIARNRVVDHWRTHKHLQSLDQAETANESGQHFDLDNVALLESGGEAALIQYQTQSQVRCCLAKLPHYQREAVLLKESGFSVKELAKVANVGFETAKSRLKLAYKLLRSCLEVRRESA